MRSPSSWITLTARCPSFVGGTNCGSAERFGVAANRGQRRHQLVRHVGQQLAARAIGFDELRLARRQIGGHAIERVGDRRHFIAADRRRARGQIAFAKSARRVLDGAQARLRRPEDHERGDRPCRRSATARANRERRADGFARSAAVRSAAAPTPRRRRDRCARSAPSPDRGAALPNGVRAPSAAAPSRSDRAAADRGRSPATRTAATRRNGPGNRMPRGTCSARRRDGRCRRGKIIAAGRCSSLMRRSA